ncbi:FkbM family methyltransferase [bacterium]|nr:MAG: FkbM family methyltransferase [bacterium]
MLKEGKALRDFAFFKVIQTEEKQSKMVPGCFVQELLKELHSDIYHSYGDNYDFDMLGTPEASIREKIKTRVRGFLRKRGLLSRNDVATLFTAIQPFIWFFHRFEVLYYSLADAESRHLLIQIVAFRILGHEKVKLPLNNPEFWKQRSVLHGLAGSESLDSGPYRLPMMDLNWIGYPVRMYGTIPGAQNMFLLKQYEYKSGNVHVKSGKGDVVIDGGGAWGDTALYFAHEIGERGKVYPFEFIPSNLIVLEKNLGLNESLRKQIEVVNRPLWSKSDVALRFSDHGPSSRRSVDGTVGEQDSVEYFSITIDDFVRRQHLKKIDFIKMDIEGAEMEALRGAEKTLKKFKPKLAISVYHSISDFVDVFEYVASQNAGYRFYLGHYSIHWYETILFAVCDPTS